MDVHGIDPGEPELSPRVEECFLYTKRDRQAKNCSSLNGHVGLSGCDADCFSVGGSTC